MKRNAIVRIVLFSIALMVLLTILGMALGFDQLNFIPTVTHEHSGENAIKPDPPAPQVGETQTTTQSGNLASFDASYIRNLEIEWAAGSITLLPQENTTQITVTEAEVSTEKYRMVCNQSGSTLKIDFCQEDHHFTGIHKDLTKDLTITVPMDWICQELDIDSASANVQVSNLTIGTVEFDGASGICTFTDCSVDEMDMDTASGDIRFTGNLQILECDAMSANCHLTVSNCPSRIEVSTMSGDLDLTLPENCGFTVAMEAMSSDFSSDFQTTTSNGHHIHGDGSCRIQVDAMSGDVTIRKGSAHHDEHH